jgi:hypothetical protein
MNTLSEPGLRPGAGRWLAIDRLRAFLTVLVVVHHAVLAYHPYAPAPPARLTPGLMAWAAFPVVDAARGPGIDALVAFDDCFFMALMFLLAGLFLPAGVAQRGASGYLRERSLRLGIPFLIGAGILAPLAYAATYWQISAAPTLAGFAEQWLALGAWPAGPAWFLWVLLAFGAAAAALTRWRPTWPQRLARLLFGDGTRPWRAWLGWTLAGLLAYLPAAALVDPLAWDHVGPFFVQTARVPLYFLYFLAGGALATLRGVPQGLLDREGPLARRWLLWLNLAPVWFVAFIVAFLVLLGVLRGGGDIGLLSVLCNVLFVLTGVGASLALLALFLRRTRGPQRLLDALSANAFGIYLLHYPVVAWLQYALLPAALPGWIKGCLVAVGALVSSGFATAALRCLRPVERIIGRESRRGPVAARPKAQFGASAT